MASMSRFHQAFCRSAPWRPFTRSVVLPWALHGFRPDGSVLEIGGGSGAMAAAIAEAFPAAQLTVTDYDLSMVEAARARLAPLGERAEVRQADATNLSFADRSFDVVLSFVMRHHVGLW